MTEGRGLLTEHERGALAGDATDNYRYKTRTYVRRRLEKLERDVEVLAQHEPELLEELRATVCEETPTSESQEDTSSDLRETLTEEWVANLDADRHVVEFSEQDAGDDTPR
jgi:cytochrome c-type biogenesis protein CcmH/NrfF